MTAPAPDNLQFDSAAPDQSDASGAPTCAECAKPIGSHYYEAAGLTICGRCKSAYEGTHGNVSAGPGRMMVALAFGAAAALLGAVIYLGVAFFLNLEFGLIAILVGWMVGKAVYRGSGNRGGRRYQALAVALTYLAISVTYVPAMLGQAFEGSEGIEASAIEGDGVTATEVPGESVTADETVADAEATASIPAIMLGVLILLVIAPVKVIITDMPGGLLSLIIIGVGLVQAWQGAKRVTLEFKGPFKLATPLRPDLAPAATGD